MRLSVCCLRVGVSGHPRRKATARRSCGTWRFDARLGPAAGAADTLLYVGVVALTAFTLVPGAAHAQDDMGLRTGEQLVIDLDRSAELHQKAFRIEQTADRQSGNKQNPHSREWGEAAELYVKAAELYVESAEHRPYGDGAAYVTLNRAGSIFSRLGEPRSARRAYAAAGVRALEIGQVYEAGFAFANAAELSQQDGNDRKLGPDYVRMAHRSSESPLLADEQQQRIRMRLGLDGYVAQQ